MARTGGTRATSGVDYSAPVSLYVYRGTGEDVNPETAPVRGEIMPVNRLDTFQLTEFLNRHGVSVRGLTLEERRASVLLIRTTKGTA